MPFKFKLTIGSRVHRDGEDHTVTGFAAGAVELRSSRGKLSVLDLAALVQAGDFKVLDLPDEPTEVVTFPDNVPEAALKAAQTVLEHLLEAQTGYRSGNSTVALPDEPKRAYDPDLTTLTQRFAAKAEELGQTDRWLWARKQAYEKQGIYGLIDGRLTRKGTSRLDPRIQEALSLVLDEYTDLSNVSINQIARKTQRKLAELYRDEPPKMPPQTTFNRLYKQVIKGRGFNGSAKNRRSIANRPQTPYSQFFATRPGEMLVIDSTPLDAFALDPVSFQWVQVQLTIALDLYTRSLCAWRFTPVSTKAVDAALLLYDVIRPKTMQPGWPESARWPYPGIPESIVVELLDADAHLGIAGIPLLHPESVVVDRGRVFLSQAFKDACARLGINVQFARPYTPTDKAHVERVFKTIRENFVENLPGYKGPDLFSRGANVEADAFFFLDEIDARFSEWVATYWQRRHHEGLDLPRVPRLRLSPNDMYDEGVARAGFVHIVPDERLYYELLPTAWRTVQHYGVELHGLRYDGDILNDFRHDKSPYSGLHAGKWPIRYDPREQSCVFFYDHTLDTWHALAWTGDVEAHKRPFNEATLSYAKSLVVARGGNLNNHAELQGALNELLNRMDDEVLHGRRERKLAAINAMQQALAQKDRPAKRPVHAPDEPADLVFQDSPITDISTSSRTPQSVSDDALSVFRTVDEALEDDSDDLAF